MQLAVWSQNTFRNQHLQIVCYSSSTSTPARLLRQLAPMFEIDPLFKRTFLLALPIRDIAQVLQNKIFSLHEVCWTILRVVVERDAPYLADEEVTYIAFAAKS